MSDSTKLKPLCEEVGCCRDKGHQSPLSSCFIGWQDGKGYYRFQDGKDWVKGFDGWPEDAKRRAHLLNVQK